MIEIDEINKIIDSIKTNKVTNIQSLCVTDLVKDNIIEIILEKYICMNYKIYNLLSKSIETFDNEHIDTIIGLLQTPVIFSDVEYKKYRYEAFLKSKNLELDDIKFNKIRNVEFNFEEDKDKFRFTNRFSCIKDNIEFSPLSFL